MTSETNSIPRESLEPLNSRFGKNVERRACHQFQATEASTWVVGASQTVKRWAATLPASKTASVLAVAIAGLKKGDAILGFHFNGQIESAANTATLDAAIHKTSPVAAAVSDAAVSGTSMTQVSVAADTALTETNTVTEFAEANTVVVDDDGSYYLYVTGTTAASTDIEISNVIVYVKPARQVAGL